MSSAIVLAASREPQPFLSTTGPAPEGDAVNTARPQVLVVDDDPSMRNLLELGLTDEGFAVVQAPDGMTALGMLTETAPHVVVLDIMMPGMDGIEVCRRIRTQSSVPVIMLTARRHENDVVAGLEAGADDYVTKPFSVRELVARLRSNLRRVELDAEPLPRGSERVTFDGGRLVIDSARRQLEVDGQVSPLSRTEYSLLKCLVRRKGTIVPHEEIMQHLWGASGPSEQAKLRTYMSLLRRKLGEQGRRGRYLQSHHGSGYRFEPGETGS